MDAFDEDAEPFDLKDERDLDVEDVDDDIDDDELEDATEDDVDLVVATYREDGQPVAVPLDFDLANDLDELIAQLRRLPGDSGADGFVSVAGEFFVICRVRGRLVEVLLSDVTAANDWPIARDVVDYLGEELPDAGDTSRARHAARLQSLPQRSADRPPWIEGAERVLVHELHPTLRRPPQGAAVRRVGPDDHARECRLARP